MAFAFCGILIKAHFRLNLYTTILICPGVRDSKQYNVNFKENFRLQIASCDKYNISGIK